MSEKQPRQLSTNPMAIYMRERNRRIKAGELIVKHRKPKAEPQSSPVVPTIGPDGYPVR